MYSSNWDIRFLNLAGHISTWSKDPSTKVGACAIDPENKNILGVGYNGFPRGIRDDSRLDQKVTKYPLIVHAEMNVIFNAAINGVSLRGASLYIYGLPPCSECTKGIIQSGVKRVVMPSLDYWSDIKQNWLDSWELSKQLYNEADIVVDFKYLI